MCTWRLSYHINFPHARLEIMFRSRKLLDDTHEYLLIEENRLQATRDLLDRNGKLLADVKVGVTTLLDKLTHIKLKPPQFSYCSSGTSARCKQYVLFFRYEYEMWTVRTVRLLIRVRVYCSKNGAVTYCAVR